MIRKFSNFKLYETLANTPYKIYLPDTKASNKQHNSLPFILNVTNCLCRNCIIQIHSHAQEKCNQVQEMLNRESKSASAKFVPTMELTEPFFKLSRANKLASQRKEALLSREFEKLINGKRFEDLKSYRKSTCSVDFKMADVNLIGQTLLIAVDIY